MKPLRGTVAPAAQSSGAGIFEHPSCQQTDKTPDGSPGGTQHGRQIPDQQASEEKEMGEIKPKMSMKGRDRPGTVAYDFIPGVRRNVTSSKLARALMRDPVSTKGGWED